MRRAIAVPALLLSVLLTGCGQLPYPREMEDMALLRTMGVDGGGDALTVTVSTGPRARGLQGDREPALVLSAQGGSLSAAALTLQSLSDSYVFFGYVDQLLLGEDLARDGVSPVLDYFARDVELGLGARIWVVRGTARGAVESGGDQGVDSRLTTLCTDGEMGVSAISRRMGEVYADLLEQGSSYVPALTVMEGEGAALVDGGYAVLKGDRLAGFLEGEEARGLELLAGKPSAHVLEETVGGEPVTVRVSGGSAACRLTDEGGLSLTCRVTARLTEHSRPLTGEELEELEQRVRLREEARVRGTLDRLRGWEADCLGLGAKGALTAPGVWSRVREDWGRTFARREPEVTVWVELHP